ncbi:hypothetical protein GQ44DRAFT_289498 [Phaeosphaeriaceae sp. PMI808]|nr:hypothetical protein GQ44DRAFT_289498 [Phaeosphaeriaceae sp. PMI808]
MRVDEIHEALGYNTETLKALPVVGPRDQGNISLSPLTDQCDEEHGSDTRTASMVSYAKTSRLKNIVGSRLFEGIQASATRRQEIDMRQITLTNTMRLRPARIEGDDFMLEIWLDTILGHEILQAKTDSHEHLRVLLGDYLFEAVSVSNRRKIEENEGIVADTGAINVMTLIGGEPLGDRKLELAVGFAMGRETWTNAYPT